MERHRMQNGTSMRVRGSIRHASTPAERLLMLIWLYSCPVVLLLVVFGSVCAEEKTRAKVRVLLLGDSSVAGTVCREMFPKADHLEDVVRKLLAAEADLPPVEVLNRGVNGDMVHLM